MEKGFGAKAEDFFFLFLNLSSWMDTNQKGVIKNHLVCWIRSSISEHPDELWFGSINLYLS